MMLSFLFAYGVRKGSEDSAELLWQHLQLLQSQDLQLMHVQETKYRGKPRWGTEIGGTEHISISRGIFQLGRSLQGEVHSPRWPKHMAWLGASCWPSQSVLRAR